MKSSRKLKIYNAFRFTGYGTANIPEIRLQGKWLETLGFSAGKQILVEHQTNKLVITISNEESLET